MLLFPFPPQNCLIIEETVVGDMFLCFIKSKISVQISLCLPFKWTEGKIGNRWGEKKRQGQWVRTYGVWNVPPAPSVECSACPGRGREVVRSSASGWVLVPSCGWTWEGPSRLTPASVRMACRTPEFHTTLVWNCKLHTRTPGRSGEQWIWLCPVHQQALITLPPKHTPKLPPHLHGNC